MDSMKVTTKRRARSSHHIFAICNQRQNRCRVVRFKNPVGPFSSSKESYGDSYFLVVQAQRDWAPETFTDQKFAVTVTLEASEPRLYNTIRQRVELRLQTRLRSQG